jgi:NAD(P)-dependent dehydrogenase (short-subunit alcohol dehydrogenase family)
MADRFVVVTGASTGIGKACALDLDRRGLRVFAGVRKDADGEALQKEAPDRLEPLLIDVTDQASIDAAVKVVSERIDSLYGLVNNAGITVAGPLEYLPVDEIRRQFEVNVFGHLAVTQAFLPLLRKADGGRIVFMSSVGGRVPSAPFISPYNASKHALESFGDALRVELRPWGIHVSLIEPGSIATPIWDKSISAATEFRKGMPVEAEERYGKAADKALRISEAAGRRGIPPEKVAEKVAHALLADRPRPRYMVGADARVQTAVMSMMTDRMRDRFLGRITGLRRSKD